MEQKKESYTEPTVVAHDLLRDITAVASGKTGKEQDSKIADF
jgi:hypothetical protein